MNLGLNEEQSMFEEALRRYFAETVSLDRLRAFAGSGKPFDEVVWQGLVQLGVPGLMVPQEFGGGGLGMMEAGIAAEQAGYAAAPVPFVSSVVMATRALMLSGSDAQRREWLPGIASAKVRLAVAFASALTGQTGNGTATLQGDKLSAQIDAVFEADGATHLLVYLPDGRAALVEAASARRETHDSVDATRRFSKLVIDSAPAQLLAATGGMEIDHARQVLDAGRLALACDTLGASQALLDKSIAYAKEREQFGRPIGSFQGVKYMCADMVTQLEPCRALVWHAAMLCEAGSDEARIAALQAKAHLGDVAREVSRTAIELHGGVGFTDMLGLPFWFRRIASNRQMLGGPERCRQEAAQAQGWSE